MGSLAQRRADLRRAFGPLYDRAHWPDAAQAASATRERESLVRDILAMGAKETACGTKIHSGPLSPGCRACVAGTWSCLYVTRRCQAHCFYCPQQSQARGGPGDAVPHAESGDFDDPRFYAEYVAACGVAAVGITGGEPLVAFDRVLNTVAAVKAHTRGRTYVHVYTNGLLANRERLASLCGAGVDEVRFDITAQDYDLSGPALGRELLHTTSVEIPAIPDDEDRLVSVLGDLAGLGVDHLNLHQLKVSSANLAAFADRGYTFVHQPIVAVLDSELTALRVFRAAMAAGIGLPINYCSAIYRQRVQPRMRTVRAAGLVRGPYEEVTWPGYVRRLVLHGRPERLAVLKRQLRERGHDDGSAHLDPSQGALALDLAALRDADLADTDLAVSYFLAEMASSDGGAGWNEALALPGGSLWVRRTLVSEVKLQVPVVRDAYVQLLGDGWDEPCAFACVRAAPVSSSQELKALFGEWSQVCHLRDVEVVEHGLAPVE